MAIPKVKAARVKLEQELAQNDADFAKLADFSARLAEMRSQVEERITRLLASGRNADAYFAQISSSPGGLGFVAYKETEGLKAKAQYEKTRTKILAKLAKL
jgi:hypothetical protein